MKKKLLAAVFGAALVLGACGGGGDDNKKDEGATDSGSSSADIEAVVQKSCGTCHGGNLNDGTAPAIDKIGAKLSEDEIHDIIVNGIGGMPPGILKGQEAEDAAEWLAAQK